MRGHAKTEQHALKSLRFRMSGSAPRQSWNLAATLLRSVPVGIAVFAAVLLATALIDAGATSDGNGGELLLSEMSLSRLVFDVLFLSVLVAPVLETLIFSVTGWALLRGFNILWSLGFSCAVAVLAWWFHGADPAALNRALGFFLLAFWYRKIAREAGTTLAFVGTAGAHAIWNLTSVSLWFVGQIITH